MVISFSTLWAICATCVLIGVLIALDRLRPRGPDDSYRYR